MRAGFPGDREKAQLLANPHWAVMFNEGFSTEQFQSMRQNSPANPLAARYW